MQVRHAGVAKTPLPRAKHAGAWKPIKEAWRRNAGVWQRIWQDYIAPTLDPPSGSFSAVVFGDGMTPENVYDEMPISIVGGEAPFTSSITGHSGPGSPFVGFAGSTGTVGVSTFTSGIDTGSFTVLVTDARGATATADFTYSLSGNGTHA